MATDGVKIIDGDLAHDVYWGFMDQYDKGVPVPMIRESIERGIESYDEFEYEIYLTAYALALWEIGELPPEIMQEVKRVIDLEAGVRTWTEECSEKEGKARQQVLTRFWKKISQPNIRIRKRKKYRQIVNLLFAENDLLIFQLPNAQYCAVILVRINQYRGKCTYEFAKTTYHAREKPITDRIKEVHIIGRKIPSGLGMDVMSLLLQGIEKIMEQGGVDEVLRREAERTGSYVIGLDKIGVNHKDLKAFASKFEKIGQLTLKN